MCTCPPPVEYHQVWPDNAENWGPPGSMYVVEGSLEEVQQLSIGKKWSFNRRVRS